VREARKFDRKIEIHQEMKLESTLRCRPGVMLFAPVIDVVCTMLIFFLLGSALVLQSGVPVSLPESSFALRGMAQGHVLVVSAGDEPRILLNQEHVPHHTLGERLAELAESDRQQMGRVSALVIKADRATPHGLVSEVWDLALLQGFNVAVVGIQPEY